VVFLDTPDDELSVDVDCESDVDSVDISLAVECSSVDASSVVLLLKSRISVVDDRPPSVGTDCVIVDVKTDEGISVGICVNSVLVNIFVLEPVHDKLERIVESVVKEIFDVVLIDESVDV
jgi:hypothetical protein